MLKELMAGVRPPGDSVRADYATEPAVPKPVIAAINGPCVGLGLARALYCDLRFINAERDLSTAFARRGLPAEDGLAWLLPRIVGWSRGLDLLLSARSVATDEALALGLVELRRRRRRRGREGLRRDDGRELLAGVDARDQASDLG